MSGHLVSYTSPHPIEVSVESRSMSRYVFILGAGASRNSGAPLMADFLEKARPLFRNPDGTYRQPFDMVARAIAALQVVHSKADVDLHNLESVFGVFEMGECSDGCPNLSRRER